MVHHKTLPKTVLGNLNSLVDLVCHPHFEGESELGARLVDISAHAVLELNAGYSERQVLKKILRYGIPWQKLADLDELV